jgi:hypothetical protein
MARVFISYANEDAVLANDLHKWLTADGHEVFLDHDLHDGIAVGEDWEQRLHDRLRWANAMVCVETSAYLASEWCEREVNTALNRGSRAWAQPVVAFDLDCSVGQDARRARDVGVG